MEKKEYNGHEYLLSDDEINHNDWLFAEYTNGDVRVFKNKNSYSDYNGFYTTDTNRPVYKRIVWTDNPDVLIPVYL